MFHLVNKYGNVHKKVESERKRDELIDAGYRLAEDKEPKPVKSPKTTGGKTTKGATKSTKANKTEKE